MWVMPSAVTECVARSASATSTCGPSLRSRNTSPSAPSRETLCAYSTALVPAPKPRNLPAAIGASCPARSAVLRRLSACAVASGASTSDSHARAPATTTASSATGVYRVRRPTPHASAAETSLSAYSRPKASTTPRSNPTGSTIERYWSELSPISSSTMLCGY